MTRLRACVFPAVLVLASLNWSGCFAIGYTVGEMIDCKNAKADTLLVSQPGELLNGRKTLVRTKDGLEYRGRLWGRAEIQPFQNRVKLTSGDDTTEVLWESVGEARQVISRFPKTGRIVGMTVGAAMDFTALVGMIKSLRKDRINDSPWMWSSP
jgi:hypothetical protein